MAIQRADSVQGNLIVATLTLDHPPANILNLEHVEALLDQVAGFADTPPHIVVLRGHGGRFSAGVDIAEHTPELMPKLLPSFHRLFRAMLEVPAVWIAAIEGYCLGGAAELALACDRVVAARDTQFGFPEIQVGCYPPVALALLGQKVGHGVAVEAILGGRARSVDYWEHRGVVHRVVESGDLSAGLSEEIASYQNQSPGVLALTIDALHRQSLDRWWEHLQTIEEHYLRELLPHPDVREGISAFLEKRTPHWLGTPPKGET